MPQEQGRFAAHISEQIWLITWFCPFPFFCTSVVRWTVLNCIVEVEGNSTECGKTLYLFCLEWDGNLMSYWQYFLVSGGWKAGSLIRMLMCWRMWHPNPGDGVWDKNWAEILETLGCDIRLTHVFQDPYIALQHVIEDVLDGLLYLEKPKLPSLFVKLAECLVTCSARGPLCFVKSRLSRNVIFYELVSISSKLRCLQAGLLLLLCIMYYCLFFC